MRTKIRVFEQVVNAVLGASPSRVSYCELHGVCDGLCREQTLRAGIERMRGKLFSSF